MQSYPLITVNYRCCQPYYRPRMRENTNVLPMNTDDIFAFWHITFAGYGEKALITGSPNRTERRFLFCDDRGNSYIAEGYHLRKKSAQIRQNLLLEFLRTNQLDSVHPFCRTAAGEHGVESGGLFWQIRPYVSAGKIDRATLGCHAEYGILWAELLLQFKKIISTKNNPPAMPNPPFYMKNFLPELQKIAVRKMPQVGGKIQEFEQRLAPFFRWERQADGMFAHGDFHPGNILMESNRVTAVIDWEFAGVKFPGYDMALLIGCLGMDHPENLSSSAVIALQNELYRNDYLPSAAWDHLPQMIAATRLGWLGEWLDLEEKSLVEQEIEFISILLDN